MNKNRTDIVIIMDRSGSMAPIWAPTTEALNAYLKEQQNGPGSCYASVHRFDNIFDSLILDTDIKKLRSFDKEEFKPRNGTALYESIFRAVKQKQEYLSTLAADDKPARILVAVFTDGLENESSREYTQSGLRDLISSLSAEGWTFTFIGAEQDAILEGYKIGIQAKASLNFEKSPMGISAAFCSFSGASTRLRGGESFSYNPSDK